MSWNGNKATVIYNDGREVKSLELEAAFGDLGTRFMQAVPAVVGAMPLRLLVKVAGMKRPGVIMVTDVTDLQTLGNSIRDLADKVLDWVREDGTLVEFRNGSGTKRMEITGIRLETADVSPDEADDPASSNGTARGTDESGMRVSF